MTKPDGSKSGSQHHHYQLHLAHTALCEWTCSKDQPSMHRNGGQVVDHVNERHHDNHAELHGFPAKKRALAIARALKDELFAHSWHLPPHVYAAIWHHTHEALIALGDVPVKG
jgi:hypothetical protein